MKLKNAYAGLLVEAKQDHDAQSGGSGRIIKGERYVVDDIDNFSGGTGELRLIPTSGARNDGTGWHDAEFVRKAR